MTFDGYKGGALPNPLARFQEEEARRMAEQEDTECLTCDGKGGTLSYDSDGDGAWAMTYTCLDPCPDCLAQNKCPGCGAQYQQINLNTFNCSCGWEYDEDRFNPSEDYYGYSDYVVERHEKGLT